jgi:hypothetical protein
MTFQMLQEYIRHASVHGNCTIEGDSEGANLAYGCLQQTFEQIVRSGEGDLLFGLYEDDDLWVQSWAAAHTLELNETRALAKLEQLVIARIPHVSTSAKYTIQGWKAGELRFLP